MIQSIHPKRRSAPLLAAGLLGAVCLSARGHHAAPGAAKLAGRGPVLVELFTSEGCPHCPEADAMLEKIYTEQSVDGAEIVAIEEHVDYWDRPEWVDHYSSAFFTARQKDYADALDIESLYTPQLVVDGLVEFVGNNGPRARATISAFGHAPLAPLSLVAEPAPPGAKPEASGPEAARRLRLEAHGLSHDSPAEVYMVLAEDKLTSRVQGGRNSGESWPHSSIARQFKLVWKMPPASKDVSAVIELGTLEPGWHVENLRLIGFIQEAESRRVLAVSSARLADLLPHAFSAAKPAAARIPPEPARPVPKAAAVSSNSLLGSVTGDLSWSSAKSVKSGVRR